MLVCCYWIQKSVKNRWFRALQWSPDALSLMLSALILSIAVAMVTSSVPHLYHCRNLCVALFQQFIVVFDRVRTMLKCHILDEVSQPEACLLGNVVADPMSGINVDWLINWLNGVAAPVAMTSCPPPYPCELGQLIADPDDCRRYYRCVSSGPRHNTRWMSERCSPGQKFDFVKTLCLRDAFTVNCHPKCHGQYFTL